MALICVIIGAAIIGVGAACIHEWHYQQERQADLLRNIRDLVASIVEDLEG